MTKDELDAMRARVEVATPGPWEAVTPKRYAAVRSDAEGCYVYTQGKIPADTHPDTVARQQRDAQFIAAAREDVPALLAEVERLNAERDALIKARETWLSDCAKELRETADDMIAIRKEREAAAFRRGVAAMREAAAVWVADFCSFSKADRIRALPDPEDRTSTEGKP